MTERDIAPATAPPCGESLRRHRQHAGLTQEALAAASGYSADYIRKIERGRRHPPPDAIDRLADTLGLEAGDRASLQAAAATRRDDGHRIPQLVGRDSELAEVHRLLDGMGSPVLLFSGDPGIGKTSMLEHAAELAERSGWRVIRGGCRRQLQDPYAPISGALAESIAGLRTDDREAALGRAGRFRLLLPEHRPHGNGTEPDSSPNRGATEPLATERERHLLFAAVADYLEMVAGPRGVLLVLDDLQWAGPDALDLLAILVATARSGPLRIIGAYRDSAIPAGSPLAGFAADLARGSNVQMLNLEPLSVEESMRLGAALLPSGHVAERELLPAIVRRAGGVPLYLVCYVDDLRTNRSGGLDLALPWTLTQIIGQRVAALPDGTQDILRVAAIVGRAVRPFLLTAVTGQSDDDVLTALDAAAHARILRPDEDGGYVFAHDLIRETIEQGLSPARRQLMHRMIATALEQLPVPRRDERAAEIAWHFRQGMDAERALHWKMAAGERAAGVFAHGDAATHYRDAADLAAELGNDKAEVAGLDMLGDELYRAGRYDEAIEPLDRAGSILRRLGAREEYLGVVARTGDAYRFAGRTADGIERVTAAIEAEESSESPADIPAQLADLYAALTGLYLHAARDRDALSAAEKAVSLAEQTGNLTALCWSEVSHGVALGLFNRVADQRAAFEHAARVAELLGDESLRVQAVYHHGVSYLLSDDFERAETLIRRSLDIAERGGYAAWAAFTRQSLSSLLITRGRWDEARQHAERAEAESRRLGPRPGGTYHLTTLGRILLLQGEREAGLRCLHEALEMGARYQYPPGILEAQVALAWHEVRDGRPKDAIARLGLPVEQARGEGRPWYPAVYARALVDAGDEERAVEALSLAQAKASASQSRALLADVLLQSARWAVRHDRWDDARRDIRKGLAIARELDLPYDEAQLLEEDGQQLATQGNVEQARRQCEAALAIFQRLGARPDVERLAQDLGKPP